MTIKMKDEAMFRHCRAIIFDMDGTLLDTLQDIAGAINATLQDWGLAGKSSEELLNYIGHGALWLCQRASGLSGEAAERFCCDYKKKAFNSSDARTRVYPGIMEAVHALKAEGFKLGIYTNKPQAWAEKLAVQFFGIGMFDGIAGAHDGAPLKPEPSGILNLCEAWGVPVKDAVMAGDSPVDIETAKAAGIPGIGVSWGFRPRQLLVDCEAAKVVDNAWQLMALFGVDVSTVQ
ncbi:MAG: HAD family hydrolase [Proteobacteria bacterium]|nr:HAD family hydrolase [Pseudomonadota bacterium]